MPHYLSFLMPAIILKRNQEKSQKGNIAAVSLFSQNVVLTPLKIIKDAYIGRKNINNFCDKGFNHEKILYVYVHESSLTIQDYYFFRP